MAVDYIIHSFGAGELSSQLFFRGDFEKYELGVAQAHNWFIDYRGGASTRPGTKYIVPIQHDDKEVTWTKFQFSPDAANSYIILFGDNYIRFIQDEGYALEAAKVITGISQAAAGVVTAVGHGFSNGDYVYIEGVTGMPNVNGQYFWVKNVTADTFTLHNSIGGDFSTAAYPAYSAGGTVSRVYTVSSPYDATDLAGLRFNQIRNELRITSNDFTPKTLTRVNHTSWTLSNALSVDLPARPGKPSIAASSTGSAGLIVCVTAVDALGQESLPSHVGVKTNCVNYATTAGSATFTWAVSPDAVYYNVYRSVILADGTKIHTGYDMGYIGKTTVPELTDQNIIPDYTRTPPNLSKPFADGVVVAIQITAPGSGYSQETDSTVFTITTSTGSGFIGYPIVNGAGEVVGAKIIDGGSEYISTDTIAITGGGGTGATATMEVSAASGNNPALSVIHKQRQIYAATESGPLTLTGSQIKLYNNFNYSDAQNDNESFSYDLDSEEVTPIRHLLSGKGGLLVMTDGGIWLLNGGDLGTQLTPKKASADPQSFLGVSPTPPLPIGEDIIYVEAVGSTVRLLGLNQYTDDYRGEDISILSNHFFSNSNYIVDWAYASDPFKIAWAVRTDGELLGLTIVREHKVLAWTRHSTAGYFKKTLSMREGKTIGMYFIVEREIGGRSVKLVEKFAPRQYDYVDDAWCVDCGLATERNYPAGTLTFSALEGLGVTATTSVNTFSPSSIGAYLRCGTGRAFITSYVDAKNVLVTVVNPIPAIPQREVAQVFAIGTWSYDEGFTTISGLDHLEGETVSVLADGAVFENLTVALGKITLPVSVTYAIVGLPYSCRLKTLPPSVVQGVIEDKDKRIIGVAFRHHETRGLKAGQKEEWLDDVKFDAPVIGGAPTSLQSAITEHIIDGNFHTDGQVIFAQDQPLPATILGYVLKMSIGDVAD